MDAHKQAELLGMKKKYKEIVADIDKLTGGDTGLVIIKATEFGEARGFKKGLVTGAVLLLLLVLIAKGVISLF